MQSKNSATPSALEPTSRTCGRADETDVPRGPVLPLRPPDHYQLSDRQPITCSLQLLGNPQLLQPINPVAGWKNLAYKSALARVGDRGQARPDLATNPGVPIDRGDLSQVMSRVKFGARNSVRA